jgi:hypothetical protein
VHIPRSEVNLTALGPCNLSCPMVPCWAHQRQHLTRCQQRNCCAYSAVSSPSGPEAGRWGNHADLYSVLGVTRSSTDAEIRHAFRRRAKLVHPDGRVLSSSAAAFKVCPQREKKIFARQSDLYCQHYQTTHTCRIMFLLNGGTCRLHVWRALCCFSMVGSSH